MFRGQNVTALILARAGSKRLSDKNLRTIHGKSLTEWSISSGQESIIIDHVVVSSDSAKICSIAERWQVDEVIRRPAELARDNSTTVDVILHALKYSQTLRNKCGYLVLLQPTSPLRNSRHIDDAFDLIKTSDALGAISVCRTEHPIEWMGKLAKDGFMDSFIARTELEKRSQEFQPSYQINGAIYIVPIHHFLKEKTLFLSSRIVAYVMDRRVSVDIDDNYDLLLAEWLLSKEMDQS